MGPINENARGRTTRLVIWIISCSVLVVFAISFLIYQRGEHELAVNRAALRARLAHATKARSLIAGAFSRANAQWHRFESLGREADAAGVKRHNNGVSDSPDLSFMYAESIIEHKDVTAMQYDQGSVNSNMELISDLYANELGSSTVGKFRTDWRAANQWEQNSLSNWWSASEDIRDNLKIESEGGEADFSSMDNRFYERRAEDDAQASVYGADARNDLRVLYRKLLSKIARLKQNQ